MNRADTFLASFNKIEKWLRKQLNFPNNMGVTEMLRRVKKQSDLPIREIEYDLIEFSQLRNAIVHNRIETDFIIAEPNEWAVNRILEIENKLLHPRLVERVLKKNVKIFTAEVPLQEILYIIVEKEYSQFPVYQNKKFRGLITTRGVGMWFAKNANSSLLDLNYYTAIDILDIDNKSDAVYFLAPTDTEYKAKELFKNNPRLEAILITENGRNNGKLIGIVSPKDLFGE
ncbi:MULTISPECIES: CBS domain-containing protein [Vagococcus]|uniref:Putative CBS domain containing protein n=1 Tax=Vagococcus fluvialis bH819 TaxID=1255619 RepID=A0A1X6WSA2_9ENTE|nr:MULTISPECIES: CBS domain-containing protein [Vagococcus]SLM87170.1 Putative CBS domain containing protein [Vagococcus fluvialis bH819]